MPEYTGEDSVMRMAETATACCAGDARLRAMLADDPLFREGYPLLKAGV